MARVELTRSQRSTILERDSHRCNFPIFQPKGTFICASEIKPQIHHISPFRWSQMHLGWDVEQINHPLNLLTLCEYHHQHIVHPDMRLAFDQYRKGDKEAFRRIFEHRRRLTDEHVPYWFTSYDNMFTQRAEKMTRRMEEAGLVFPTRKLRRLAA